MFLLPFAGKEISRVLITRTYVFFLSLVTRKLFLVSFVSAKKKQDVQRQIIIERKKGLLWPEPEQEAGTFPFCDELHSEEDKGGN